MRNWDQLRHDMVEQQLRARGIRDERVLEAMEQVPRHEFVPEQRRYLAYADEPLPIGHGQTISQPYVVAAMAEALELRGTETVLEVGAGSGYAAAVLARLCARVYSVELIPELARMARENLARTSFSEQVTVLQGDGSLGRLEQSPYQGISVAAGAPNVPAALLEQLDPQGGRLVIPVGSEYDQEMRVVVKRPEGAHTEVISYCRFVPLLGEEGWKG